MVYHSDAYKLINGVADIPEPFRAYTEKHHAKYLESPKTWQSLELNESQETVSRKEIDKRWGDQPYPVANIFEQ